MPRIRCMADIDAPREVVWDELADLAAHDQWMTDAKSIVFETDQRQGVGTRIRVRTKIGPVSITDLMEVTEWRPGETIAVRHTGIVTGTGRFELSRIAGGTRLTWTENLTFPLLVGGPVTAFATRPALTLLWNHNLRSLKRRIETRFLSPESAQ